MWVGEGKDGRTGGGCRTDTGPRLTEARGRRALTSGLLSPARLVAFFVCDSPKPLVIPDTGRGAK